MDEILEDLLDELSLEENTIIKMYYGIDPYEYPHTAKEIYKQLTKEERKQLDILNLPAKAIEEKMKELIKGILRKVRGILIEGEIDDLGV